MATVLAGLRVLDFTEGMDGSLATMLLADNGAEVIKVERPGGDPYRAQPAWIMWNRGKQSVVLDLSSDDGRASARAIAATVDVVIENFRPGYAESIGLGYEALSSANPRLVYCSITAIGSRGPYRHFKPYNSMVEAKSGGFLRGRGNVVTYRVRPRGDYGAAMMSVQGIAAALRVRHVTGLGQRVETSHFAGIVFTDSSGAIAHQARLGMANLDPSGFASLGEMAVFFPYLVLRCKDGRWIQMANLASSVFPNWFKAMGLEHIYQDERFKGAPFSFRSSEDQVELRRMVIEKMQEKTLDEWLDIFLKLDVGADRLITTQQAMDHPQVRHIGGVVEADDPAVGRTQQIGPLVRFAKTPAQIGAPSPRLGQDTAAVLASLDAPSSATVAPAPPAAMPDHPFAGMLILDFATWNAAPQGASLLADMGARVIKIEPPNAPDEARRGNLGRGRTFQGKESVVVDLKTEEGRKIVSALIAKADGMIHNMRGSTPQRLGIDYESARAMNPNIVYLYAGSYGSTGPDAPRAAFHPIAGGLSGGALWQLGRGNQPPENDVPLTTEQIAAWGWDLLGGNESLPDQMSALGVGTALSLALYHKARTGEGQYLETSMIMSNLYVCSDDFIRYDGKPARMEPDQALRGLHALHRLYEAREGWVFITCPLEEEWQALREAMDLRGLTSDSRFATREDRLRNSDDLVALLWPRFKERTADEWESYLGDRGVACVRADGAPYADFLLKDPGVREAGLVQEIEHPTIGKMLRVSPAVEFSLTPGVAGAPHLFGEDTRAVLGELGFLAEQIDDLKAKGVIGWDANLDEVAAPMR